MKRKLAMTVILTAMALTAGAREFHVSVNGNDANDGSPALMLKTILSALGLLTNSMPKYFAAFTRASSSGD